MPLSRRRVTDAAALKALAHPLRLSLLELLVTAGAHTASQAAVALEESPANCSWHLRKLAEHGFVREAPGAGGRNRPWRAVTEALTWDDTDSAAAPGESSAAGAALTDLLLEREVQRLRAARAAAPTEPPQWRQATSFHQSATWLTAHEAEELTAAMAELFLTHAERIADPGSRPDGARLVSLVGWLAPTGPAPKER